MPDTAAAKPLTTPPNVKMVGRYTVLRVLRRDRYTTVYVAFDPVLARELIVKAVQLHPSNSGDRAAHERVEQAFMRQAQAAGRLHHPHIVTVFDAAQINRIGYIALEKVDGKLLEELLAEGYHAGFLQAADIVARVADAVEFAHSKAVPHGHLSPSRIYLQGPERTPKVMGFGGWIDSGTTGDFELHGTDSMLPFFGDEISGEARRKDVRALGALLFLLLTGVRPDAKMFKVRAKGEESPILRLRTTAPPALAEIAEQALELGGARVFNSAAQMRNALTSFLWGNRCEQPLPNSATITGMPARIAVMPKAAATMTVNTVATPLPRPVRERRSWRVPLIGTAVGIIAIAALALLNLRGMAHTPASAAVAAPVVPAPAIAPASASAPTSAETSTHVIPPAAFNEGAAAHAPRETKEAPRPATGTAAQGTVALAIAPWGAVFVNGEARGTTPPLAQLTLPAGRHMIEIRNGEQPPYVTQVDVTPERPQQIRHRFQ
jgi:serine/threonine-protein kinase